MKKTFTFLLIAATLFSSCRKEKDFLTEIAPVIPEACEMQTQNPAGRSYSSSSVVEINTAKKSCGLIPMNSKNYWVYEDSVFINGSFSKVQYDTLRYTAALKSTTDGLVWWESSLSVGIPEILYANDSALFTIENRFFTDDIKDVKQEFSLFSGDSLRYITSFEDVAAIGRSIKLTNSFKTPAGAFKDCIYIDKNARNYRRDQVYLKPGLGVVKFMLEQTGTGTRQLRTEKILTLVAFHIE